MVLTSCACLGTLKALSDSTNVINNRIERAKELSKLMIEKLNPFQKPFLCYVELQLALLKALHRLSNVIVFGKHMYPGRICNKFAGSSEFDGKLQMMTQPQKEVSLAIAEHLNVYGFYIAKALHVSASLSIKLEALDWISSFCEGIITMNSGDDSFHYYFYQGCDDFRASWHMGLNSILLFPVLCAASDRELKVRARIASVLQLLLQAKLIYPVYFEAIANTALERLGDPDPSLQAAFRKVLSLVVLAALYSGGWAENADKDGYKHSISFVKSANRKYWHWKQVFAIKQLSQPLRSQQLVSVLNYISQRCQVVPSNWLQRLVFSYRGNLKSRFPKQRTDAINSEAEGLWMDLNVDFEMLERVCSTNNLAAAWWAIHEAARHCITVCLRTRLGGPTQTFAAIERMLLDVAQLLQVDPGLRDASGGTSSPGVHLLPMRLLLEFVESLKKHIYNAYEGSAVLPAAPSQSALFFRRNKKVCEEWFARICEALMNASLAIQCHAGTFHYAAMRLQDLRNVAASQLRDMPRPQIADNSQSLRSKYSSDVLRVLRHASLALCRLHESDALVGLHIWATSTFSALPVDDSLLGQKSMGVSGQLGWMTGLVYQARGQYEKAAAHFTHLLQSEEALGSMGADEVQFVIARIIESYVALADWDSLDRWLQELQLLRAKHAGKSHAGALTTAGNEMNAIHALARFDGGDIQGAWGYLDLTPQSSSELTVDPRQALNRSEQMLLQAMLRTDSKGDEITQEIERAKAMLEEALLVASLDGLSEASPYATQFHCIYAFEEGRRFRLGKDESGSFASILSSLCEKKKNKTVIEKYWDWELTNETKPLWVKVHPKLVQDVQLMIAELGIITVLWEEQWLSTLQDLHADVTRRIATLKEEVSRVAENVTLTHSEKAKINAAKYSAKVLQYFCNFSTSRTPETAHEDWFQKEYGEQLKAAITNFKTPPSTAASLADVWRTFDAIAASLANHQKKSSVSLSDVAPQLARLSSSDAPMPGLEKQMLRSDSVGAHGSDLQGIVTVSSFSEQVSILATKTKPKKLIMLGSDGQRYTYLLKGREDLRLDARIMQLLQAVNGMLHASTGTLGHSLAVRYYSVTPISGRAGLIQWVDNLISMYSVFKAWQQRVQYAQFASNGTGTTNTPIPPVPRPSDMFYGKIIPALKEKGLRKVISRRDWPQEVKRKVLLDLMKETPRQLLYREIWCASGGFQAFNLKFHIQMFSGSVAVMSMVGHILGLGDRHLDNILMDFSTGDVVHIDYNVCFDKGLRLKIPEIVPFRLTQTMQAALGLTGIEGEFRANCEAVIEVLRKNKDIILMLLEVFVWDPLIEWMRGDGHDEATIGGEERKGMELAVSLSLFASRVQEIRVPLQSLADALDRYERISTIFVHAEQERSKSVMSESSAKSIVAEAASNLEKFRIAYEVQAREFAQAKALATEAAQKAALWVEQHSRVLDALRTGSAPEIQTIGQVPGTPEALSLTSAVLAAGVPLTIVPEPTQAHCRDVDREVAHLTTECHEALLHASKALQTYSMALQRLLPGNYIATSQVHGWAQVLQLSVRKISPDALALARRQASDLVAKAQGEHADSIHQKYETLQMKVEMLVKEIRKVQGDCAELEASIESENERKAKDRVLAIFTKHLHPSGHLKKDEDGFARISGHNKQEETKERDMGSSEQEERKAKILTVLHVAAATLYSEIKEKISDICNSMIERIMLAPGEDVGHQNWKWCFPDLEEQVERCALVAGIVNEVQQMSGQSFLQRGPGWWDTTGSVDEDWASSFQSCLTAIRSLVGQMVGFALPEAIKSVLSHNPAIMEAFGSLSQIRGAVDTSLEQLAEIEMQRASLAELERSYYENVGEITERKSALETAAAKGRDHLSWEEAEELASQEEACRAQLDQLHKAWSQRGAQASALVRKEGSVRGALVAAEQRFQSLVAIEQDGDMHLMSDAVKRAQGLLLEYCNVHETARAAKAAASSMKMQVGELTQDLQKANLEVSQLEWLHDFVLPPQQQNSILTQSSLNEEMLPCSFVKLNRRNLLENIRSAMSTITRATEGLQGCERTAISTEEQLERAMGWACAGPNTGSGASNSGRGMGIPPEFHDHLRRRRQLLWAGQDQAAGVLKLCAAVLEFEASRDGFLRSQPDVSTGGALSDGRAWQQAYMNMISRLDVSYHSFTCADREWQLAQKSMEAASSGLSSATNDLRLVSLRAKSASGELQSTLSSMRDGTVEASAALSAFCRVARGNYALTTETGSMLEENEVDEAVTYNGEDGGELVTDEELVLQGDEDCWISPPDSLYTSGSDSEVTSVEDTISQHHEVLSSVSNDWEARGSGADKTKLAEEMMPDISRLMVNEDTAFTSSSFLAHSQEDPSLVRHIGTDTSFEVAEDSGKEVICTGNSQIHATKATSQRPEGSQASVSSNKASSDSQSTTHVNLLDMGLGSSNAIERHQMGEIHPGMKPRQSQLNRARGRVGSYGDLCTVNSSITTEQGGRAFRGKNAYAVSVLKRVEAKLDGWDVDCKRQFTISEQVDHLLRQATSIDNLCNMYEGWTPWI